MMFTRCETLYICITEELFIIIVILITLFHLFATVARIPSTSKMRYAYDSSGQLT